MTWEYTRTREEVCLDLLEEVRDTWSGAGEKRGKREEVTQQ
jgi:hypothetical protein